MAHALLIRDVAPPWRVLHRASRERLLLGRLRWCAALAYTGALVGALQAILVGGPDAHTRFGFALAYMGLSLAAGIASRTIAGRGHELAAGYVLLLVGVMSDQYVRLARDVALAPAGFVSLIVGVTVLLPWGAWPQAATGAACLAGFAWVLAHAPGPPNFAGVTIVVSMVVVSIAAAGIMESYRAESFEPKWRQERFVSLARELAARVDADDVRAKVLEHALELVPADFLSLVPRDPARRVYRVDAIAGPDADSGRWLLGVEFPEDVPLARTVLEREMFVLPADDPDGPPMQLLANHGGKHALWVPMRYGGDVIGVITFSRKSDQPFDPGEQRVARALADHAALALRTARMVADLRQASRLKSEFVSTMSHELRTPLNVILGYAEMAEDPAMDAHGHREAIQRIKGAGRDLLELIENTLQIGKIEAGHEKVELEPVPLREFWHAVGDGCARMPRQPRVELDWQDDMPAVSFETDPRKLTVIVRNLVGNALKFTDRGHVQARMHRDGDALVVVVSDTGIGIAADAHETIFEMFRQADQSDTRRFGGTGLGLFIVRRFAQQLGGTVTVESEPGRGSRFTVRLPDRRAVAKSRSAA